MVSRAGPVQSVIHAFPYLGRGVIVALAVVSIITTELSVSTTWSAASSVGSSAEVVNRAQKGDRLPLVPMLPAKPTEQIGFNDQALPVGCEAVSSPLAHSRSAHIARGCVS
jgi:hypothetical protein